MENAGLEEAEWTEQTLCLLLNPLQLVMFRLCGLWTKSSQPGWVEAWSGRQVFICKS